MFFMVSSEISMEKLTLGARELDWEELDTTTWPRALA
jgi:hypothetical protein